MQPRVCLQVLQHGAVAAAQVQHARALRHQLGNGVHGLLDRSYSHLFGNAIKIRADYAHVTRVIEQKGIMPVRRVDLGIAHVTPVVEQGLDDFAAALGRRNASRW